MHIEFRDNELEIKGRKISDDELVGIAKELIALRSNETELEKKLQEFDMKYPKHQLYLGYKLVEAGYGSFCINKVVGRIESEEERLNLAEKMASGIYSNVVISNIDKFDLQHEKSRLDLAKIFVKNQGFSLAKNIDKFDIQDERERVKLARELVKNDGSSLIYNIEKFNISNEADRLEIAKGLVEKNAYDLAFKIEEFRISNDRDRIALAKELILKASSKLVVDVQVETNEKRLKKAIDMRSFLYASMLEKVCAGVDSKDDDINKDIEKCKQLIKNIRNLKEFYERIKRNINFDMVALLKEDNAKAIIKVIDDIQDVSQKQFVIETVEKVLFIVAQRNIQVELDRKDEITRLIIEFATIRKPELKGYLLPLILTSLNRYKLDKVREEMLNNTKKKAYPAINSMVFDKLSLYREQDRKLLSSVREVFSKNSFLKNSKDVQDTLMALIKLANLCLPEKETKDIVRFLIKNANDISKNSRYIMSIIAFGNKNGLSKINEKCDRDAIKKLFYDMYNKYISTENNEEFMKTYEKFVNLECNANRKFEECLMIYIANNSEETCLNDSIKEYLTTMSDKEKFREGRYDINSSKHLKALNEIDSEVYRKWSKGQEEFKEFCRMQASSSSPELVGQITDDPVDLFLIGTEVDGSCQHVNGMGYNKALMGYVMDGKNKAVVVKNSQGRIIARSIIRLLIEEETNKIVMAKEKMYKANGVYNSIDEQLNKACIDYAKWLGVSLVCNGDDYENKYTKVLESKGGMAPYEYVDMNFGMTLGSYKISYAGLKYLYEEGSENNGSRND